MQEENEAATAVSRMRFLAASSVRTRGRSVDPQVARRPPAAGVGQRLCERGAAGADVRSRGGYNSHQECRCLGNCIRSLLQLVPIGADELRERYFLLVELCLRHLRFFRCARDSAAVVWPCCCDRPRASLATAVFGRLVSLLFMLSVIEFSLSAVWNKGKRVRRS